MVCIHIWKYLYRHEILVPLVVYKVLPYHRTTSGLIACKGSLRYDGTIKPHESEPSLSWTHSSISLTCLTELCVQDNGYTFIK